MIHEGLEHSGSTGKSHQHDQELKGALTHLEGCLPFVSGCNLKIVVARTDVKLGVDLCAAKLVEEVGDKWYWVLILPSNLVEVSKVDTESEGAILLLGKENRHTCWQLG